MLPVERLDLQILSTRDEEYSGLKRVREKWILSQLTSIDKSSQISESRCGYFEARRST